MVPQLAEDLDLLVVRRPLDGSGQSLALFDRQGRPEDLAPPLELEEHDARLRGEHGPFRARALLQVVGDQPFHRGFPSSLATFVDRSSTVVRSLATSSRTVWSCCQLVPIWKSSSPIWSRRAHRG